MKSNYRLSVEICDEQRPASAVGILLAIPPTTPHQEVLGVTVDPTWSVEPIAALNGAQRAYLASFPGQTWRSGFAFDLFDGGSLVEEHFATPNPVDADPGDDARELAVDLSLSNGDSHGEKLLRIIDCVSQKFKYQSGYHNNEALTCNVLTGNCLSINSAIMKLARLADVRHAYYIGFYFRDERSLSADDWHCWIGTLTERGYESWDVAHQLKRGGGERIKAGLNPVPGRRFAMSVGRDLVFELPIGRVIVPHLCGPRWIFSDGSSERCMVRVTLKPISRSPSHATHAFQSSETIVIGGSRAIA